MLFFMNACETAAAAPGMPWERHYDIFGLARAFLETGAYLVGSRWKVGDEAAAAFASAFYKSLVQASSLGRAVQNFNLCVTLLIKHGKVKWAWVPGIGLVWDLVITMTASYQKVFSDDPKIGYFTQRSTYQDAMDNGELLAPATDMDQMQKIVTNSTVNGTLQAIFALLVIVIVLNALLIWFRAVRAGGLPTTEVPHQPSHIVAPADFFATKEEKEAVREWEASHDRLAGTGGSR